jgi:hypothetical protein
MRGESGAYNARNEARSKNGKEPAQAEPPVPGSLQIWKVFSGDGRAYGRRSADERKADVVNLGQ